MFRNVMDDSRCERGIRQGGWLGGLGRTFLVICIAGLTAGSANGQGGSATSGIQATVVDISKSQQRVTVALNRSLTIDTTVEVTRADVISPNIANVQVVSPKRMLLTGQSFGTTSVVLHGADGTQYVMEVSVELNLDRLNAAMRDVDPQSNARAESIGGHIVLTGTASGADQIKRITGLAGLFVPPKQQGRARTTVQNHLQVSGEQQVLLRCVVAEVSRSASRELGVNGFLAGKNFKDGFLVNQLGGINPINIGAGGSALVTQNLPFFTDEEGISISRATTLSLGFPRVQAQLFIRAMADNNLLRILAEPNLVAISGEEATFLAGGEFPILVPQGDFRVTVEFREFGVQLKFTPFVRGNQRIRLKVNPVVSELDFSAAVQLQGFTIPGLTTRSMSTTVELGSGQTIAIAGLLQEQIRGVASRIPGLGDVPVLGALFRSVQFQRSQSELVILVTPEIIAPLEPHQAVKLPGSDIEDPSDMELYALGLLESTGGLDEGLLGAASPRIESQPEELSVHGPWGHAGAAEGS